jgi:pheromone a factor receptor
MVGLSVAIPTASLCINRRLYFVATQLSVTKSKAEKRREVFVDLAMGIGIPVLEMALRMFIHNIDRAWRFTTFSHRVHRARSSFQHL